MDPNQNNSGAPTLVIMAFLMGVAGVVVQSEYLKSARPPSFKSIVSHKVGMENVDARLWQDPLSAMNSDIKNQNKGLQHKSGEQDDSGCGNSHSFDIFLIKNEGKRNCFEYKDRTITFLGVTTRWGPYLEDQETRRNMRYAVVSGLTASDFIPDDPEHIGYMTHTNEEIRKRSRDEDAISNSKAKGESVDKSSAENNCGDRLDGKKIEDNIPEDQSLVINTKKGLVLISGCGHAGIVNTLEHASEIFQNKSNITTAIGGFHLFNKSPKDISWTAKHMRKHKISNFLGAHCTGIDAVYQIRKENRMSRDNCSVAAVGSYYDLKDGLFPGLISK